MHENEPPTIEHDPGEFRRPVQVAVWSSRITTFILLGAGVLILGFSRGQKMTVPDAFFILLFLAMMCWFIVPSVSSILGDSHQDPRQSLAFRMGKALHKVLHLRRRNTTVRD